MLNPFIEIYDNIYKSIKPFINSTTITPSEAYYVCNRVLPMLGELNSLESKHTFRTLENEVIYYKEHWVIIISTIYYISYFRNIDSDNAFWFSTESEDKKIINSEINLFLELNKGLHLYYLQSASHLDDSLFTHKSIEKYTYARIISYCNLRKNIDNDAKGIFENKLLPVTLNTRKTNVVLLIYLIESLNYFDKTIATKKYWGKLFEEISGVPLGSLYEKKSKASAQLRFDFKEQVNYIIDNEILKDL